MSCRPDVASKVDFFWAQRHSPSRLVPVPSALEPVDADEAYAVLSLVHAKLATEGHPRIGYKIGCTTSQTQAGMNTDRPVWAGLLRSGCFASIADAIAAPRYPIAVECEIAVTLSRDLTGDLASMDDAALLAHLSDCALACEVVENRYGIPKERGLPVLIADDFLQTGFVLGPSIPNWQTIDLTTLPAEVFIDGSSIGQGLSGTGLGGPLAALRWLAQDLHSRGRRLQAGDVVLTGAMVPPFWLLRGHSRVEMRLGELRLV